MHKLAKSSHGRFLIHVLVFASLIAARKPAHFDFFCAGFKRYISGKG